MPADRGITEMTVDYNIMICAALIILVIMCLAVGSGMKRFCLLLAGLLGAAACFL